MKKIIAAIVLSVFGILPVYADTPSGVTAVTVPMTLVSSYTVPAYVDTAANAAPVSQIEATLLSHVVAVNEFTTKGQNKLYFLDGVIQAGHFQGNYIAALDAGFCNSLAPDASGRLAMSVGFHVHAISFVNSYLNINPALAQTLDLIEATPRVSWDTDVHKAVYGFTVGARIPF